MSSHNFSEKCIVADLIFKAFHIADQEYKVSTEENNNLYVTWPEIDRQSKKTNREEKCFDLAKVYLTDVSMLQRSHRDQRFRVTNRILSRLTLF